MRSQNSQISLAYKRLALGIVERALIDYVTALKSNNPSAIADIEMFFYSQWFTTLCDYNPDFFITKIKQAVQDGYL